jgi:hypothetical protein
MKNMRKRNLLLSVVCLAGCLMAQSKGGAAKVGASAVWPVTPQFMTAAHAVCDSQGGNIDCLISQMSKAGAPAAAVSFTRALYKQSHGDFGIMTGFQGNEGPVSFAWITYPLRANTNYGLMLVNGRPPLVNIEDLKLLDTKTMKQSPQFQDLKNQFPQVDIWPGDRDGKTWPEAQAGTNGGTQYVVGYPLINGCHACARAGSAIFTWNFDAHGKFLGTAFQGMTPAPL